MRPAFQASNLGQMAQDDAIKQFVHDSRVRIGRMIVAGLFDLNNPEDIAAHHKLLHELLKPFWYKPCAMFVTMDEGFERAPGLGFVCIPEQKYHRSCSRALDALMKVGLPPAGKPGTRQRFTYNSGTILWQGVAKDSSEFTLPEDPKKRVEELKKRSLFMINWTLPALLVATDLSAADAMESVMSKPGASKDGCESLKVVMAKTALADWAFRWHVDVAALLRMLRAAEPRGWLPASFKATGLDRVRGIGGTGGYADKVYTRMTYIDCPGGPAGLLGALRAGGSYQRAFSMVPSESTFCLAGQLDAKSLLKMVTEIALEAASASSTAPATTTRAVPKVPEPAARALKQLELMAEASDGHVGMFVTDLQAVFMGMMMGPAGMPMGAVVDLKDREKATRAIDELVKLAGDDDQEEEAEDAPPALARAKQYRQVPIRYVGDMVRLAILKDRLVIAAGDTALKAAIDTALDKTGGFQPGSEGHRLAGLCGEGPVIFKIDLPALAKLGWPLLMTLAQAEEFPLASLPSTNKMVRMLGPEIAVIAPDAGGVLLKSRGKIPFATKFVLASPLGGLGLIWMMFH